MTEICVTLTDALLSLFIRSESKVNLKKLMPDYEPTLMPCGCILEIMTLILRHACVVQKLQFHFLSLHSSISSCFMFELVYKHRYGVAIFIFLSSHLRSALSSRTVDSDHKVARKKSQYRPNKPQPLTQVVGALLPVVGLITQSTRYFIQFLNKCMGGRRRDRL